MILTKYKYKAFISYSHRNEEFAQWLHKALETYRIPRYLRKKNPSIPTNFYPIFRDQDELPTSSNLSKLILDALQNAAYMIVICSPQAAKSHWVNQEIKDFKRMHGEGRILAVILDGEPNADQKADIDNDMECFPEALKYKFVNKEMTEERVEPIAADVRGGKETYRFAMLKLIAGLLDVGFEEIMRREELRNRKRRLFMTGALAGVSSLAAISIWKWQEADEQRHIAQTNEQEALRQKAIALANEKRAKEELAKARHNLGLVLYEKSEKAYIDGDPIKASLYAYNSLIFIDKKLDKTDTISEAKNMIYECNTYFYKASSTMIHTGIFENIIEMSYSNNSNLLSLIIEDSTSSKTYIRLYNLNRNGLNFYKYINNIDHPKKIFFIDNNRILIASTNSSFTYNINTQQKVKICDKDIISLAYFNKTDKLFFMDCTFSLYSYDISHKKLSLVDHGILDNSWYRETASLLIIDSFLIKGTNKGLIIIYDIANNMEKLQTIKAGNESISSIVRYGKSSFITASYNGDILFWNHLQKGILVENQFEKNMKINDKIYQLYVDAKENFLYCMTNNYISIIDIDTIEVRQTINFFKPSMTGHPCNFFSNEGNLYILNADKSDEIIHYEIYKDEIIHYKIYKEKLVFKLNIKSIICKYNNYIISSEKIHNIDYIVIYDTRFNLLRKIQTFLFYKDKIIGAYFKSNYFILAKATGTIQINNIQSSKINEFYTNNIEYIQFSKNVFLIVENTDDYTYFLKSYSFDSLHVKEIANKSIDIILPLISNIVDKYCLVPFKYHIKLIDIYNLNELKYYDYYDSNFIYCSALEENLEYFFTSETDGRQYLIVVYKVSKNHHLYSFLAHKNRILSIVPSKIDNKIVTCSEDGEIKIWKYTNKNSILIQTIDSEMKNIKFIDFLDNDTKIMVGSKNGLIKIFDIAKLNDKKFINYQIKKFEHYLGMKIEGLKLVKI